MSFLALSHISKSFGSTRVLTDLSLEIAEGEFFFLVGPSGCGKSTVLRIIAGLERAESGTVLINGTSIDSIPPQKRGIGMVFQQYALWPHMTIAENVRFGLENLPLSGRERDQRMKEALDLVRMGEYHRRYPHQVSGGQQQRVALARALAIRPQIILLDEPLSNLDARLRQEIREELASLHSHLGTTMLYVTHDRDDALALATRIALLREGQLEQVGTAQELYARPRSSFCAQFMGDSNLLPCTVRGIESEGCSVELESCPGRKVSVPRSSADGDLQGRSGFLCIRPELVTVAPNPPAKFETFVTGRVIRTKYRGASFEVVLDLGGSSRICGTVPFIGDGVEIKEGSIASAYWAPQNSCFLRE